MVISQGKTNAVVKVYIGITSLKFCVAGEIVASIAAGLVLSVTIDGGDTRAVNVNWDLGERESQTVTYEIQDQDDDVIYSGSITVNKDQCTQFEMTP